jgi:hypothetical protein
MKRPSPALWTALLLTIAYGVAYYAVSRLDAHLSQPDAAVTCSPHASPTALRTCP